MTNHLNFFVPFQSAPAWHENQLTRALLVVLRYSPMAHQAWLERVAPGRRLYALPPAEFATQRQRVLSSPETLTDSDAIPGISVWLAHRFAGRPIRSPFLQRIVDDMSGRNLLGASRQLDEIARFERVSW